MDCFTLSHLSDVNLRRSAVAVHSLERSNTALAVAHLAEVEARSLHLAWGYASISAYGIEELRLSPDAAYNRIRVTRTVREFPALFEELAAGTLHLASILLLAPRLTRENADELIRAAAGKSRSEIETMLLNRQASGESPDLFAPPPCDTLVPGRVDAGSAAEGAVPGETRLTGPPLVAAGSTSIKISTSTREKLLRLKDLLAHQVPSGDLGRVLDRVCDIAIRQIERRRFAATDRPRAGGAAGGPRSIPAEVRRTVRARDGDYCAFVSDDGHRCASRSRLEFDHVVPVARGGRSTVENVRLLCRAHNQFVAEKIFGSGFMAKKRARGGASTFRTTKDRVEPPPGAPPLSEDSARRAVEERTRLLLSGLRELGFREREARDAAEFGVAAIDRSLEDQMRRALSWFRPRTTRPGA